MQKNNIFVKLDTRIPLILKNKLVAYAKEKGLNITSALITILNEKLL